MRKHTFKTVFTALILAIVIIGFISLFLGRYTVEPLKVLTVLWQNITGQAIDGMDNTIIMDIRLPRVFMGVLIGAGLSAAGAAFQGCFHNPLVSPDLLGVSSGAGFGAALGILFLPNVSGVVAVLAFAFGLLSVILSWFLSRVKKGSTVLSLVLSGIIVSAVFNALISLIKFVADTDSQLPAITYWLMGSLANTSWKELQMIALPILLGILVLIALRWRINILTLGDEEAVTLGISPERIRGIIIVASTIITASAVMMTGIIGWVGLIIPNLCRMIVGSDYKYLMPTACLMGGAFMLIVDLIARSMTAAEIPIGILTAIIGAPFFALIYIRTKGV